MPEDLKVSQIGSSPLPPPFRGLHSPGVRKLCQIIFACYFRKSSIVTLRAQEQCERWTWTPIPVSAYGLCHEATLKKKKKKKKKSKYTFAKLKVERSRCVVNTFLRSMLLNKPPKHTHMKSPWYNRTGWLGVKHQLTYYTYEYIVKYCFIRHK